VTYHSPDIELYFRDIIHIHMRLPHLIIYITVHKKRVNSRIYNRGSDFMCTFGVSNTTIFTYVLELPIVRVWLTLDC